MLDRQAALSHLRKHIHKENLIKHMLACEACMEHLAKNLGEDAESWALAGLLHDIDYEMTTDCPNKHGIKALELLPCDQLSEDILDSIQSHAGHCDRKTIMAKALYAVDPLTGLVVASVLMTPTRRLKDLSPETVLKRYKEKRFAAGACREQIASCAEFGLSLEDFVNHCVCAMQNRAGDLGL